MIQIDAAKPGALCRANRQSVLNSGLSSMSKHWINSVMLIVGDDNDLRLVVFINPNGSIMMRWHKIGFIEYYFSHIC
jgi:hypothetical protein